MFIFPPSLKMRRRTVTENLIIRKYSFMLNEATEGIAQSQYVSEEKFLNRLTPFKFMFVSNNSNVNMTIIIPKSSC